MPKTKRNLPVYEYPKKVNGQIRYYIRPYINGKQITKRVDEKGNMWLGYDGYLNACIEVKRLMDNPPKEEVKTLKSIEETTFNEAFLELMEDDALYNRNSESSRKTYTQRYNRFIKKKLGKKVVIETTNDDLKRFIVYLKTKTDDINYTNLILQLLKRIYLFIIDKHDVSPKIQFNMLRKNRDEITQVNFEDLIKKEVTISPQDWQKFTQAIEDEIDNAPQHKKIDLIKLLVLFSCEYILLTRVGESQGIKFKNLIPSCNLYVLYEAYNKYLKKMTPTKNRKARLLYMPQKLVDEFIELYRYLHEHYNIAENDFLFVSSQNKNIPISRATIDRYRAHFCKKAGIKYATNHELRRAGISNSLHNEVDASAISDMAGHDKKVMFDRYVKTLENANADLLNSLNKIYVPKFSDLLKQDQKQDQRKTESHKSLVI